MGEEDDSRSTKENYWVPAVMINACTPFEQQALITFNTFYLSDYDQKRLVPVNQEPQSHNSFSLTAVATPA